MARQRAAKAETEGGKLHFVRPEPGQFLGFTIERIKIDRIIPLSEVREHEYYWDMADLAEIFNHEIVEMHKVWRWRPNAVVDVIYRHAPVMTPSYVEKDEFPSAVRREEQRACLNLNTYHGDLHRGWFSMEEHMKFYMQLGYSLSGYGEVFGQHEAHEFNLPGAKRHPDDEERDTYAETVIDYMCRIHKGHVLKL